MKRWMRSIVCTALLAFHHAAFADFQSECAATEQDAQRAEHVSPPFTAALEERMADASYVKLANVTITRARCPLDRNRGMLIVGLTPLGADLRIPKMTLLHRGREVGWFGAQYTYRQDGSTTVRFGENLVWEPPPHASGGRLTKPLSYAVKPDEGVVFNALDGFSIRFQDTFSLSLTPAYLEIGIGPAEEFLYPPEPVRGLWWDPGEPGWGLVLDRNPAGTVYANWHTFDAAGNAVWFVMPNGVPVGPNAVEGDVYFPTGPAFSSAGFDSRQFVAGQPVGRFRFEFTSEDVAAFSFDVQGHRGQKAINRLILRDAYDQICRHVRGAYWNAGEPGWALALEGAIDQYGCPVHAIWSTYGADGRPTWFFAGMNVHRHSAVGFFGYVHFRGDVYRPKGPFFGAPFDRARFELGAPVGYFELTDWPQRYFFSYAIEGRERTVGVRKFEY